MGITGLWGWVSELKRDKHDVLQPVSIQEEFLCTRIAVDTSIL